MKRWMCPATLVPVAVVLGMACRLAAAAPLPTQSEGGDNATLVVSHIRALDAKARHLVERGNRVSPTFRLIVERLERSDVFVHIDTRPLNLPGQLQFLAATPSGRHVHVSIGIPGSDSEMVAWLAHELWHATEIAGDPGVHDQASLRGLYGRIGYGRRADMVESTKAQSIWIKVLYEVREGR